MGIALLFPVLFWILDLYTLILTIRVILDFVPFFLRGWVPRGPVLIFANIVYRLTDPPLRLLSRYIPPLRLGGLAFDLGFLVLFCGVNILRRLLVMLFF
ncbi:YggT family protein [Arcanobacterium sp. S3PF19]|uniref:YggT family protein n=1 Tax=Arcanobacterium sp. S3PF19 TaxID=1219585 RepID=UPI0005105334|nr:YggT family protein [Arcanobacterium sp. S3PF19]KGF05441.1 membrane protein [Arcanobacterium sp. S3PF19]